MIQSETIKGKFQKETTAPCGEICTYTGERQPAKVYPYRHKKVNCENMMLRMKNPPGIIENPPLREPPAELYDQFTQFGASPLIKVFMTNVGEVQMRHNPKTIIYKLMKLDKEGRNISLYPVDGNILKTVLTKYKKYIEGANGLVVGTQKPWVETYLINLEASTITTSEYGNVLFEHPKLSILKPHRLATSFLEGSMAKFDFAVSFSSIEHSGLGRYGDPLNPFGDFEAVAQVWCMCKPGALFFLAVPASEDEFGQIVFNAHRIYGKVRLQHLTANWRVLERYKGKSQDLFVLKKDNSA